MPSPEPLPFDAALTRLLAEVSPLAVETLPLPESAGRRLAGPARARGPLPAFDHATMDGFALRASEFVTETSMPLHGEARAGRAAPPLRSGHAMRIFTGAPMPAGADAVVAQEDAKYTDESVHFAPSAQDVVPGKFVRRCGSELAEGAEAAAAGSEVGPGLLALLALLDLGNVSVYRRPRVVVVPTGDELRAPGSTPWAGSIPEANGAMIAAMARANGAEASVAAIARDDRDTTLAALSDALRDADVVVPIGGVSVGDHDHVPAALDTLGVKRAFYKIAIKPGKPLLFGTHVASDGHTARVLALPGNPASAFVTFFLFGLPLLRALAGAPSPRPVPRKATLRQAVRHATGRLEFLRGRLHDDGTVEALAAQASGAVTSLAAANALLAIPAELAELAAGSSIDVYPLSTR